MYIFEWCTLLKCSSKCPCTCILTAIINISNKIGSIITNCMSNECIHAHSNLAKSGIWSIDCEIWDMGYWGVKNMGYGIFGVKNLGYGILGGKKYGIWDMGTPVSPPPPPIGDEVDRVLACGTKGREFESRQWMNREAMGLRKKKYNSWQRYM